MCGRTDVVDTAHRAYSNVSVTVNCIQISHMIPLRYGNTSIRERLKSIQRLVNTNGLHVKIQHWLSYTQPTPSYIAMQARVIQPAQRTHRVFACGRALRAACLSLSKAAVPRGTASGPTSAPDLLASAGARTAASL